MWPVFVSSQVQALKFRGRQVSCSLLYGHDLGVQWFSFHLQPHLWLFWNNSACTFHLHCYRPTLENITTGVSTRLCTVIARLPYSLLWEVPGHLNMFSVSELASMISRWILFILWDVFIDTQLISIYRPPKWSKLRNISLSKDQYVHQRLHTDTSHLNSGQQGFYWISTFSCWDLFIFPSHFVRHHHNELLALP